MHERRGLVIERSRNRVTAVTKDGEFVRWKDRRDLMPGEEVVVPSPRFQGFSWQRLVLVTCLTVIFVLSSFFGYQHYLYARPVMAYVTFDSAGETAGSIELEVNDRGLVKSAVGLNEAGAEVLAAVKYEMKPVEEVLVSLKEKVAETEEVIVAFVPLETPPSTDSADAEEEGAGKGSKKESKKREKVADLEKQVLSAIENATTLALDIETRNQAKELGISAGRAASWALWNHKSGGKPDTRETEDDPVQPSDTEPGTAVHSPSQPGEGTQSGDSLPGNQGQSGVSGQPGNQSGQPDSSGPSGGQDDAGDDMRGTDDTDDGTSGDQADNAREAFLSKIRGTVPRLSLDELDELDKADQKEIARKVGEVTKEWLKAVKKMTEDDGQHAAEDAHGSDSAKGSQGQSDQGNDKPGKAEKSSDGGHDKKESVPGGEDTESGQDAGKNEKNSSGGSPSGSGKGSSGSGKGSSSGKGTSDSGQGATWNRRTYNPTSFTDRFRQAADFLRSFGK